MSNFSNTEISHYKVLSLPLRPEPNSVYYVLDQVTNIVRGYIVDKQGAAIPIFSSTGGGVSGVASVTGTGVTGTTLNPKVDIATFVSSQLGNLVHLSAVDGRLVVNQIISPDASIDVVATPTELHIQLAESIQAKIETALQPGDNVSLLYNDGDGFSPYITEADLASAKDKNFVYEQAIPSNTWSILHNLNKYPSVTVLDSARSEVQGEVVHNSINLITIVFNSSFSGTATLN